MAVCCALLNIIGLHLMYQNLQAIIIEFKSKSWPTSRGIVLDSETKETEITYGTARLVVRLLMGILASFLLKGLLGRKTRYVSSIVTI